MTSKPGLSANHWATVPSFAAGDGPVCPAPLTDKGHCPPALGWRSPDNPRLVGDRQTQMYIWFLFPPGCGEVLGEILIHGWFSPLLAELEGIKMSGFK